MDVTTGGHSELEVVVCGHHPDVVISIDAGGVHHVHRVCEQQITWVLTSHRQVVTLGQNGCKPYLSLCIVADSSSHQWHNRLY